MHTNIIEGSLAVVTASVDGDEFGFDAGDLVIIDHYDSDCDKFVVKSAFDESLTCNMLGDEIVALNKNELTKYLNNNIKTDEVTDLQRLISCKVQIVDLNNQIDSLLHENKSLKGAWEREKEYKQEHLPISMHDAKRLYNYISKYADDEFRGTNVYSDLIDLQKNNFIKNKHD